jgi:hypothetical protein
VPAGEIRSSLKAAPATASEFLRQDNLKLVSTEPCGLMLEDDNGRTLVFRCTWNPETVN